MIAEALEFLKNLKDDRPIVQQVGGDTYAVKVDRTLGDVIRKPAPLAKPTLVLSTLTGFVDAYKRRIDDFDPKEVAVHVEGYNVVALVAIEADEFGRRHTYLRAKCEDACGFLFLCYYANPEEFLIAVHTWFAPTDNAQNLIRVCSNLTSGSSVQTADDGLSQRVVVHEGGVTRTGVDIPPRIALAPYRTFREVTPVESDFLLRMQGKKDALPQIALFPVDGGRWKTDTVLALQSWLQAALPDATVIA